MMSNYDSDSEIEIEYLTNYEYGRYEISTEAYELYKSRFATAYPTEQFPSKYDIETDVKYRMDPILIQIYHELGEQFNGRKNGIICEKIPKKYKDFAFIRNNEGYEMVTYDYKSHILQHIKYIVSNPELSDSEKVSKIQTIYNTTRYAI